MSEQTRQFLISRAKLNIAQCDRETHEFETRLALVNQWREENVRDLGELEAGAVQLRMVS